MVDPLLEGRYSVRGLHHAIAIASMCVQEQAGFRPLISDVVMALEYLNAQADAPPGGRYHSRTASSPSHLDILVDTLK